MGKVLCEACSKKCSGNVLRVGQTYFHIDCFRCKECKNSLAQGGFFTHTAGNETSYHCAKCYQQSFGAKCAACNLFVEGEVVTALGNTYHQSCFRCHRCNQSFATGEKVTWTGKECLCAKCIQIPVVSTAHNDADNVAPVCSSCHGEISEGQALIALEKHWHIWCFKCETCGTILHGEYLNKDGRVYCEKDYQKQFGIKCHHCGRYITGKVLQAGDNHFHPTCARCTKCGDIFSDGEEMYIQGAAIWHPRCGPGPGEKLEMLDGQFENQYYRAESPSMSSSTKSRSISPFGRLSRQTSRSSPYLDKEVPLNDLSRVYTYSYLTAEPTQGYLRKPLEPRPPKSPQFHRPADYHYKQRHTPTKMSRQGMQAMVDHLQSTTPRPKSPSMNNEEPIELAHYPNAKKPNEHEVPCIERDDFPAPPFPYTDPQRRKFYSSHDDLDEIEENIEGETARIDPQLKKEEQELSKISSGIGRVFLKTVKEREKVMAYRKANLDPRKSSRTPSAKTEIPIRLRYDNPVNASPSRDMDRPKPWEEYEDYEGQSFYRNSTITRSQPYINYNMVSSLRHIPKPGYGLKNMSSRENGHESPSYQLEKTQSIEFSSGKSDISIASDQNDKAGSHLGQYMNHSASGTFRTTPFSEGYSGYRYASYSPHLRRSMPNVNLHHHHSSEPPRQYPYHLLITNNYRLPPDVDRCHLERHLQNSEFEYLFGMNRMEFYRLPEWKRNELKRRAKLF